MRSRTLISFSALAGFVVLAFGSGDMSSFTTDDINIGGAGGAVGGNAANEPACRAYIQAYNSLDCLPPEAKMDGEVTCGAAATSSVDMSEYFECLAKGYTCNEQGLLDASGAVDCTSP